MSSSSLRLAEGNSRFVATQELSLRPFNPTTTACADSKSKVVFKPTCGADGGAGDIEEDRNGDNQVDDAASEASTILYDQEPFDTFQKKVAELAESLFPSKPAISVEHMKGGSYNRVIGFTVTAPSPKIFGCKWFKKRLHRLFQKPEAGYSEQYIVRIPRWGGEEMEWEVARLNVARKLLSFPIPRVVKYDLSGDNVIEKSYMIQTRLPGQNLSQIGEDLNLEQWKCIAKRITGIVSSIAACTSHTAGDIGVRNLQQPDSSDFLLEKYGVPSCGSQTPNFTKPNTWPAMPQEPLAMMLEQCERWREYQTLTGFCFEKIWNGFVAISKALHKRGFLDGPFALVHGDLYQYNLLAEIQDESTADITGVIDWDFATFAPKFMAYRAPFWLWQNDDIYESRDCYDENLANVTPTTDLERELKRVFEENASDEFKYYAFAKEAILARRMFKILKEGMFSTQAIEECKAVIGEWKELHPQDDVPSAEDDGSDSDSDSDDDSQELSDNDIDNDDENAGQEKEDEVVLQTL